ncbi:hypothetical protein BM221_006405 [Beauveria bassiana]|uniref:Uncharacterized protein n=1 Tax=Beauveria bassiana TaxID=176275 RepID=A0A2N6NLS6_BEABA|nr:hypothetical protein BM221_006405 [Beauveria bassiana]
MSVFYIDSLFHPAPSQTLTAGSFLIESGSYQEVEHIIEVAKTAFETLGEDLLYSMCLFQIGIRTSRAIHRGTPVAGAGTPDAGGSPTPRQT